MDENDNKKSRLTQYLDFVKLYTEVHKENTSKRDANLLWKENIQKEFTEELSMGDYMEQLAILTMKKKLLSRMNDDEGVEFMCAGAEKSVRVAGTFNNWEPQSLDYNSDGDYWVKSFVIPPGTYTYKYVVDGEWMHDPSKDTVDDGKGNVNNVIHVEDKYTVKLRRLKEEIEELRKELDKPWYVESPKYSLCPKLVI